ncbi:MAG: glycogen debranching N-terminal domain-containing protein, partial [Actinomycetota bacterium]
MAVPEGGGPDVSQEETAPVLVTDLASRVLAVKEGDLFLYSDTRGNLSDRRDYGLGLYYRDTRFLSHFQMTIAGREAVLLSSSAERAYMSHVDLTNPDLFEWGVLAVRQQTLNIRRIRAINGRLFERIRVKNYNPHPVTLDLELTFGADFADIFEIRQVVEATPLQDVTPEAEGSEARFTSLGRDGVTRRTVITFASEPDRLEVTGDLVTAVFRLHLGAYATKLVALTVEPQIEEERARPMEFDAAVHELRRSYEEWDRDATQINTDNEVFNQLLARSQRDLRALYTRTGEHGILAAGIPWYVTVFGRDALIAAHQMMMVSPQPAREALQVLASMQGT